MNLIERVRKWWKPKEGDIRTNSREEFEVLICGDWIRMKELISYIKDESTHNPTETSDKSHVDKIEKLLRGNIITKKERNSLIELINQASG